MSPYMSMMSYMSICLICSLHHVHSVPNMNCRVQFHFKTPLRAPHPSASTQQQIHHLAERWSCLWPPGTGSGPRWHQIKKQSTTKRHPNGSDTSWGFTQARVTCFLGRCEGAADLEELTCACSPEDSSVSHLKSIHGLSVTSLAWKAGYSSQTISHHAHVNSLQLHGFSAIPFRIILPAQ